MEVTALCIRLFMNALLLLVPQLHLTYSDFPQIVPNRQQHFQYAPITVSCEGLDGLTGWRVMRKVKGDIRICASTWEKSTGPCEIKTAYPDFDSGEYWCVIGAKRSNTVNITVTAGSVILESPVLPVMEGENVTLRCRNKINSSNLTANFYKDDFIRGSSSTGEMTIQHISKSVEGLYKCSISGVGESSESWLAVREAHEQPHSSHHGPPHLILLLCISITVVLVALLLLVGLLQCRKRQTIITGSETGSPTSPSSVQPSSSPQTVFGQASVAEPSQATYAVITKPRGEKGKLLDTDGMCTCMYVIDQSSSLLMMLRCTKS
ncbi:low affinity immunoglobulin gamma Fc region receptor II-like [Thunnus albacares]|uniref:low affinity immunoglobulin gamma Fc region receptor II-like n=1 Tax=Thunnus albacares TaxID=8236 RepID=UPI001CF691A7|nr:low affinity immunoglobulin gamma Fc region receptor II-like [Thunnus albacares]